MKTNWQIKKLFDVVDLVTKGTTPKTYGHSFTTSGVPFLRAEDIKDSIEIENIVHHISKDTHDFLKRSKTKSGDVLLTIAGTIGRTAVVTEAMPEMNMNQAVAIVRPKKELDPYFLSLFFRSDVSQNQIIEGTVGMAIPNFSLTMIKNLEIPLPPLETQEEIVAKLDEKFAKLKEAKSLREKALADTEEILSQTLREIFEEGKQKGWEEKTVGDISEVKGGKRLPKGRNLLNIKTDHPYLRVTDFKNGILNERGVYFIDNDTFNEIKRYTISSDDIFISIAGTIGLVCKIPEKFNGANLTENAAKITNINTNVLKDFLYWQLRTDYIQEEFSARRIQTTISKLALFKISEQKILIPSLSEQQKIVKTLDELSEKIKSLRELQTSQLTDLKQLEKAYLKEAFNGELI